jgi:hypothetical protein
MAVLSFRMAAHASRATAAHRPQLLCQPAMVGP